MNMLNENRLITFDNIQHYHDKLYNVISGKQDKIVSGTNIKTINGASILGSGDIISNAAYQLVNHGVSNTIFTLASNTFYIWDEVTSLTLTIEDEIAGVANKYIFRFISGSEPTTLILPDSIKFNSDFTIEENKIYQISILNGFGTVMSWDSISEDNDITVDVDENSIHLLSNVEVTEDSIILFGNNIKIDNDGNNNYNIRIE